MKMNDILKTIQTLSLSQGFYGRLLNNIIELKENNTEGYEELKRTLEAQKFNDMLDVVMFFEG